MGPIWDPLACMNTCNSLQVIWAHTRWDTSYTGASPAARASHTLFFSGNKKYLCRNVLPLQVMSCKFNCSKI